MRGQMVQPAMGSRELARAARLRAAARVAVRELSRLFGKGLVQLESLIESSRVMAVEMLWVWGQYVSF